MCLKYGNKGIHRNDATQWVMSIRSRFHCDNILDNRLTSPRRGNMNQNVANEMNGSPYDRHGPTDQINRYDTPKVNDDCMIIIPQDVIRPKSKSWTKDYIAACLSYCPVFDKRCWDKNQKLILDHRLTGNTSKNQKSWGDFLRNDMLVFEFNAACKDGWKRGTKTLMNAPKEDGDAGPC